MDQGKQIRDNISLGANGLSKQIRDNTREGGNGLDKQIKNSTSLGGTLAFLRGMHWILQERVRYPAQHKDY
jgi:hypothetical protein